jgi:hypothetical protein
MLQEIQRLKSLGLGKKTIARALNISKNTVKLHWEPDSKLIALQNLMETSSVTDLAIGVIPGAPVTLTRSIDSIMAKARYSAPWAKHVDWDSVKKSVDEGEALALWLEEQQQEGSGLAASSSPLVSVPYSSFWREFKRRYPDVPLEFHKNHPPGERTEIDYKGERGGFGYFDSKTDQFVLCEMFGAVLCFSQLLFIEATLTQRKADFLSSIHRTFVFFGGVTPLLTSDNLKSAVHRADRYDPDLNPDFSAFCSHYGTAGLPARPRKPKDKNLIEGALGIFWRWIRSRLKKSRFYSLGELNAFLRIHLVNFNARTQRRYGTSRQEKFEAAEKAILKPLPAQPYEICEWATCKLHWDCFGQVGKNFFSAPYALRGKELSVRITGMNLEFFYELERVALHRRPPANQRGQYFRKDEHLPPAHKAMLEMVPQKCLQDAKAIGPETVMLIEQLITKAPHPLTYLRRCLGILRLKTRYDAAALESACKRANSLPEAFPRLQTIEGILKAHSSFGSNVVEMPAVIRQANPNLRGQNHWTRPVNETNSE